VLQLDQVGDVRAKSLRNLLQGQVEMTILNEGDDVAQGRSSVGGKWIGRIVWRHLISNVLHTGKIAETALPTLGTPHPQGRGQDSDPSPPPSDLNLYSQEQHTN
jgi:hypothetical protein